MSAGARTVGFTGTQIGMTPSQKVAFIDLLGVLRPTEFRHGDCIGADADAHDITAFADQPPGIQIVIHPPSNPSKRAWRTNGGLLPPIILPTRPYLDRNRDIVDASEVMIGASRSPVPLDYGGTWYTINYAIRTGRPVHVLWPSGHVTVRA